MSLLGGLWMVLGGLVLGSLLAVALWSRWLRSRQPPPPRQTTFVYCPNCRNELGSDTGVNWWHDDRLLVHYICTCATHSCWDFDLPVPVLVWSHKEPPP